MKIWCSRFRAGHRLGPWTGLLALLVLALGSVPAAAAEFALVPAGTEPSDDLRVDVRSLGTYDLWIAPDTVRPEWPSPATVLRTDADEELFLIDLERHGGDHARQFARVAGSVRELARLDRYLLFATTTDEMRRLDDLGLCRERVRWLGAAPVVAPVAPTLARRTSTEEKATLVDAVNHTRYSRLIQDLSGHTAARIGGAQVYIQTRNTYSTGSPAGIDDATAYLIEQLDARGYTVLEQTFTVGPSTARNLIAVREGTVTPNEVVVVGAHYDSTSEKPFTLAPGAEDNASGAAAVVHLAEVFSGYETERTVHFVLFGGEEQGLYGSQYYVSQLATNGWTAVGALTMDMISAWRDDYAVVIEGQLAWQSLMQTFQANVVEYAGIPTTLTYFSFGSDHVPFQQAGIPAFLAIDDDWDVYEDYHRSTDRFEKTDTTLGWKIARAMAGAVVDLAGATYAYTVDTPARAPELVLEANRPNPFNPRTEIGFTLPVSGRARLEVFDLRGRLVRTLLDAPRPAGTARVVWDGTDDGGTAVASGTYLYRLRHPAGERVRRMLLVR